IVGSGLQRLLRGEGEQQTRRGPQVAAIDNKRGRPTDLQSADAEVADARFSTQRLNHRDTETQRREKERSPHILILFSHSFSSLFLCVSVVTILLHENSFWIGSASMSRTGRSPGPGIMVVSRLMPMPW